MQEFNQGHWQKVLNVMNHKVSCYEKKQKTNDIYSRKSMIADLQKLTIQVMTFEYWNVHTKKTEEEWLQKLTEKFYE